MPEARLQRTRAAYRPLPEMFRLTNDSIAIELTKWQPRWRPLHENAAERLKRYQTYQTEHETT